MKVIKIGAIWCGGCLVMNGVWNKLKKMHDFDYIELDLDMDADEAKKYNPGDKLPVFIVMDNGEEVNRLVGEYKLEELEKYFEDVGVF